VSELETPCRLKQNLDRLPYGKPPVRLDKRLQVLAVDKLHDVVKSALHHPDGFEAPDDVGMLDAGQGCRLLAKSLNDCFILPGERGGQHLQGKTASR
jgi:hypothetical protein